MFSYCQMNCKWEQLNGLAGHFDGDQHALNVFRGIFYSKRQPSPKS